jgi:hypothetical protein
MIDPSRPPLPLLQTFEAAAALSEQAHDAVNVYPYVTTTSYE